MMRVYGEDVEMMRELEEFAERCRRELTEDVLPFWLARGWDRVHGGVYTCLGRDGALMDPTKSVWFQGHSLTMILINVARVLKQVSDDPALDAQVDESIDRLFRHFVRPEFACVLETVGLRGEFLDTCAGRTINPGHGIETSWFLMDVARAQRQGSPRKGPAGPRLAVELGLT